ncbi:MAG TPA: ParB/RepB/Spo0J family partition protein [Steroidobacteraceae bacterium]|nr:ParB/RepB/Spo0J family partition protein [Steroidobacteraceae bacterium]
MSFITVHPSRCRVWNLHPRLDETLTEESCRKEIESFENHGQLIPVLGRRLRNDPGFDVELIYGARRLFVARCLNFPLKVDLREISDRDGIIAMDAENRLRRDISPYERSLSYSRWLREGHFRSSREIANALQISNAQVSRLLKLVRLPQTLIEAFVQPCDICEAWGERLVMLLADAQAERQMLAVARDIASANPRPAASEVFAKLCAAANANRTSRAVSRVVSGDAGDTLFSVTQQRRSVVFTVPLERLSHDLLARISQTIAGVVDHSIPTKNGTRRVRPSAA